MQKTHSVNRKAILHNISITCPTICYLAPARLFVTGNKEVKCKEGTIKLTEEVKRHLQVVTGNEAYKKSFTRLLVDECVEWLKSLSKIVESGPPKCELSFCWGIYRKTNILYNKNFKFRRYDMIAVRIVQRTFS